jgi:AcrR family transcriptional regulator
MNKISLQKGRINQKLQTRAAILHAAKNLMGTKKKVSLEDIADKANVSRATIYRYFPSVELLITEASLDIHHQSPDELLVEVKDMPLNDRIFYIQNYYNQLAQDHELVFRRYLSTVLTESITSKKKIRGSRRIESMKIALQPFKKDMPKDQFENLINISALLMGIDSLIVTKDVCDLSNAESNKLLKWGIDMILKNLSRDK